MDIRSLGIRSQLIFNRFEGIVTDHGDHLAIRTPDNPTYRWGNYLLFERPPQPGDRERWTRLFHEEIGTPPEVRHLVFAWDTTDGATGHVQPFLDAGFELERDRVLTARRLLPQTARAHDLTVRALESDADWSAAVDLQVRCRDEKESEEGFRVFRERKMRSYRAMQDAGLGFWFGGFAEGSLVTNCGLFAEHGIGRYQHVETDPEARRRGYARTLLAEATAFAHAHLDIDVLVIHADPEYHAIELYRSLGFEDAETLAGLEMTGADNGNAQTRPT